MRGGLVIFFYLAVGPHPHRLCLRALRRSALLATTVRLVKKRLKKDSWVDRAHACEMRHLLPAGDAGRGQHCAGLHGARGRE